MDVLPLNFYAPATTSSNLFTNPWSFDDRNLQFKKRSMHIARQDSSERNECPSFATVQEEEDYYSGKVRELFLNKFTEIFACEDGLATTEFPSSSTYKYDEEIKEKKKRKKERPSSSTYKEDKEIKEKKKRKILKKVKHGSVVRNEVTERLERFVTSDMNGLDMKLVIQKSLYESDLKPSQNRLNMPIKQLQTQEFLKSDEKLMLDNGKEIEVRLVGPTLQMYKETMMLKKWRQKRTYNYVLITNWNRFVAHNKDDLKEGTKIQVWSFRRNQQLCFALAIVGRPNDGNNVA